MTHATRHMTPIMIGLLASLPLPISAAPPNFVIILADDLGYGDLGCYGSQQNDTPNIDQLAAEGLRLTDYHSNGPMCSATRAALLTGCYQQRFGKGFDGALGPGRNRESGLPLSALTIAEVLKPSGYATGMFGKWHLGYKLPLWPTRQGFDEFVGLASGDGDHHTQIDRSGNEDWWHGEQLRMEKGYTAEMITRHSIDFIERHKDEPFLLYVAHLSIHFPWQGPDDPPHRRQGINYTNDKWGIVPDRNNVAPLVKSMVEALDQSVGEIMDALSEHNLSDNTLVVFASDNGGYINYQKSHFNISSNGPLKGQKGGVEEGGHRVPCVIHWPGQIAAGRTSTETVLTMDFFPTFVQLAGADLPDHHRLDGIDVSSLLLHAKSLPERMTFWRMRQSRAARLGPWKLNLTQADHPQLYNLSSDIGEKENLAAQRPQLVGELTSAWHEWEHDVNAGYQQEQP